MKNIQRFMLICAALSQGAFALLAQEAKPVATNGVAPGSEPGLQRPAARAGRDGKVLAIDTAAKTITIGPIEGGPQPGAAAGAPQVYLVTRETLITKDGKLVKLPDVAVGEPVRYVPKQTKDGKNTVTILRFGKIPARSQPKPE